MTTFDGNMVPQAPRTLLIADETLTFREVSISDPTPAGGQILAAAEANSGPDTILLQLLPTGELESIRLDEHPDLRASNRFLISVSDGLLFFTVDGTRLEWPHPFISAKAVRIVSEVSDDREIWMVGADGQTVVLEDDDLINLSRRGVESLHTRPKVWQLRVQGVVLDYGQPLVKVADAMKRAGFDPTKAWHIYLIVEGQPKQEVTADFIVDLRTKGIEKIRLMQRNVDNGDGQHSKLRRQFNLLPVDERYLDGTGLRWETIIDEKRRWLLIHDFRLLPGYAPELSTLALDIHSEYPASQIDMFYFSTPIARCDGQAIPNTQVTANIEGIVYQGWSRHRNGSNPWDPHSDNVATHLALVESCLAREFGE